MAKERARSGGKEGGRGRNLLLLRPLEDEEEKGDSGSDRANERPVPSLHLARRHRRPIRILHAPLLGHPRSPSSSTSSSSAVLLIPLILILLLVRLLLLPPPALLLLRRLKRAARTALG